MGDVLPGLPVGDTLHSMRLFRGYGRQGSLLKGESRELPGEKGQVKGATRLGGIALSPPKSLWVRDFQRATGACGLYSYRVYFTYHQQIMGTVLQTVQSKQAVNG